MRGKFITTSLKLAVLAKGKQSSLLVKETKATIGCFETFWSKDKDVLVNTIIKPHAKTMQPV